MNPYAFIAALAVWFGSAVGAFFYGHHLADQACAGKVQTVQDAWDQQTARINAQAAQQAAKAAAAVNAVTEKHHETTEELDRQSAVVQARIKITHDAAAPADCLRAPVDPALDQLLRHPAAAGAAAAGLAAR